MKDPWTENKMQQPNSNAEKAATSTLLIRVFGLGVWCFDYLGLMWFFEYRNSFEKILGFVVLGVGAIILVLPRNIVGEKYWTYSLNTFFALSLLLVIIVNI